MRLSVSKPIADAADGDDVLRFGGYRFDFLAKFADVNMVIDQHVSGETTLHLKNVTWNKALKTILMAARNLPNPKFCALIWLRLFYRCVCCD